MNKYNIFFAFLLTLLIAASFSSKAQNTQDTTKVHIQTIDGNEYIGNIIDQNSEKIKLKTEKLGELSILRVDIKKIDKITVSQIKGGTYWLDNAQATRYFWVPNGYGLKKGEGYYQNVWIFFNQAVYSFSDHFSGGIGVVPLFLFAGTSTPAWLTMKFSIPVKKDKFNVGAGLLAGAVIGEQKSSFGIFYGVATLGSKDNNVSAGLGWGYSSYDIAKKPTINISAMFRTGPKGYFITENYFFTTPDNSSMLFSFGFRSLIKSVSLDYGLFVPINKDINTFVAIPWLGLSIPFGNKAALK